MKICGLRRAKQSYETLRRKQIKSLLLGFSMGGIIAGLLAKIKQPDQLVLIAPAFENINIQYLVKSPYTFINNMRYADLKILDFMVRRTVKINYKSFVAFKNYSKVRYMFQNKYQLKQLIIHGTIDGLVPIENLELSEENKACTFS